MLKNTMPTQTRSAWESAHDLARTKVVLTDGAFNLTGYRRQHRPWTGTYALHGDHELDLHADSFEIGLPQGPKLQVAATDLHAAFKVERVVGVDHLTICYPMHAGQPRPTKFDEPEAADGPRLIKLVRADAGFVDFPKNVTMTVLKPDGAAAAGAYAFRRMQHYPVFVSHDGGKTIVTDRTQPQQWTYYPSGTAPKSDADGAIRLPISAFESEQESPVGVHDAERGLIGFIHPTAALLQRGAFTIRLHAMRIARGTVRPDVEVPFFSPTVTLGSAEYLAEKGEFNFPMPPGAYLLTVSGQDLYTSRKWVTVPEGVGDIDLGKVVVHVSEGPSLIGKTAPPLEGVVAWKNGPVDLAAFEGKVLLINFWGYWCGGCVNEMPTLFHLYDKYKDSGLAIVSVHIDGGGEVDTVEKLDERTARYRNGIWRGRDVPFPTALTSGRSFGKGRSRAGAGYGITGYPTTVIIGRDGRVMGELVGSVPMMGSKATLDLSSEAAADASVKAILNAAPQLKQN
ncbi:MAG TPA: TlpA disulfide reductase family protein [Tepidisphaeraceae bacterium]